MIDDGNGNLSFNHVPDEGMELQKNKKSKWKFILGCFLVVVAIGVGLYIGYSKITSNPLIIYKNAINGVYNILNDNIKELEKKAPKVDLDKDSALINLNVKLDSNLKELEVLTKADYTLKVGLDNQNKKVMIDLGINKDNKQILNVMGALLNGKAYLKSEKIFNKTIDMGEYDLNDLKSNNYFPIDEANISLDYEGLEYALEKFRSMIIDSLDKEKFEVTDETLNIENKKYKVKKALYKLDKENMDRTLKFVAAGILKDDKLVNILASLSGKDKEDLKENLKNTAYDGPDIQVVLYADSLGVIIAGSLTNDKDYTLEFNYIDKMIKGSLISDNNKLVVNENKDTINVVYTEDNEEVFNLKFAKGSTNEFKVDYTFKADGAKVTGTLQVKDKNINDANKWAGDFNFKIAATGEEDFDLAIDGSYEIAKAPVVIDVSDSVKVSEISEEELMSIYTKLGEVLQELDFDLTNLITGM